VTISADEIVLCPMGDSNLAVAERRVASERAIATELWITRATLLIPKDEQNYGD